MAISSLILNQFIGGGLKNNNVNKTNGFSLFITLLLIFLINSFIVMWCYNMIIPNIINNNNREVYKLTYGDAIILLILVQTLLF